MSDDSLFLGSVALPCLRTQRSSARGSISDVLHAARLNIYIYLQLGPSRSLFEGLDLVILYIIYFLNR